MLFATVRGVPIYVDDIIAPDDYYLEYNKNPKTHPDAVLVRIYCAPNVAERMRELFAEGE